MSSLFLEEDGPQPPKQLKTPVEIQAHLRMLQESRDPLLVTFEGRSQRFQTFLVQVDRERNLFALDEFIPNDGHRHIAAAEPFRVEGFHDGVKISWDYKQALQPGQLDDAPCYWGFFPETLTYHQRRNAFRATLHPSELVEVDLSGKRLTPGLKAQMLDVSATGCKLRFNGNVLDRLRQGEVYEDLSVQLPFGKLTLAAEYRHGIHLGEVDQTYAGFRFHRPGGQAQRLIERFVYQLQRDARRNEKSDLF